MLLTREASTANLIRNLEPGRLRIADRWIVGHVIVAADHIIENWPVDTPKRLTVVDLAPGLALAPEVVLLGTGPDAAWPDADLTTALAQAGIGLEIMSTSSACRTYNLLVHERRRVIAALFNPVPDSTGG